MYKLKRWCHTIIRVVLQNTSNLLMQMIFTMVDAIRVRVRKIRFSTL